MKTFQEPVIEKIDFSAEEIMFDGTQETTSNVLGGWE